jgi:hypothetical protein
MNTSCNTLDDMAFAAIHLGRELQRAAQSVSLGANNRDIPFVTRALGRVAERDPFDPRDDASFEVLQSVIESDLRAEVRGTERRFFETYYDAAGQHGEMRDFPIYSERGEAILGIQDTLKRFLEARAATLDRVAAERALIRLLAS